MSPTRITSTPEPWRTTSRLGKAGLLETTVPPVLSVPEGPDVALTQMQTTLGPSGLIYNERRGGKTVFFRPEGILLPRSCPRDGFRSPCA